MFSLALLVLRGGLAEPKEYPLAFVESDEEELVSFRLLLLEMSLLLGIILEEESFLFLLLLYPDQRGDDRLCETVGDCQGVLSAVLTAEVRSDEKEGDDGVLLLLLLLIVLGIYEDVVCAARMQPQLR
jgi:hypothetical protein